MDFETCVNLLKNKGEVSENERAYQFIMSECNINRNKFVPESNGGYKGEIWGAIDKGYVIIQKNIFSIYAKKGNFSEKSFLSWAQKKELLSVASHGFTKQRRIEGAPSWCVFLKLPDDTLGDETPEDKPKVVANLPTDAEGFVTIPEDLQGELPFQ